MSKFKLFINRVNMKQSIFIIEKKKCWKEQAK